MIIIWFCVECLKLFEINYTHAVLCILVITCDLWVYFLRWNSIFVDFGENGISCGWEGISFNVFRKICIPDKPKNDWKVRQPQWEEFGLKRLRKTGLWWFNVFVLSRNTFSLLKQQDIFLKGLATNKKKALSWRF